MRRGLLAAMCLLAATSTAPPPAATERAPCPPRRDPGLRGRSNRSSSYAGAGWGARPTRAYRQQDPMSARFCVLACDVAEHGKGPEATVALRKLLEGKDAAVRSVI